MPYDTPSPIQRPPTTLKKLRKSGHKLKKKVPGRIKPGMKPQLVLKG